MELYLENFDSAIEKAIKLGREIERKKIAVKIGELAEKQLNTEFAELSRSLLNKGH